MRTTLFLLLLGLLAGCRPPQSQQSSAIVLGRNIQLAAITDAQLAHPVPKFPLPCEAVGFDRADGTFEPVLLLSSPFPRGGSETRGIGAGWPHTIKVYQGTNEIAAKNHFLGEFAVTGFGRDDDKSTVQIGFNVDAQRNLVLSATDERGGKNYNVHRIDRAAKL